MPQSNINDSLNWICKGIWKVKNYRPIRYTSSNASNFALGWIFSKNMLCESLKNSGSNNSSGCDWGFSASPLSFMVKILQGVRNVQSGTYPLLSCFWALNNKYSISNIQSNHPSKSEPIFHKAENFHKAGDSVCVLVWFPLKVELEKGLQGRWFVWEMSSESGSEEGKETERQRKTPMLVSIITPRCCRHVVGSDWEPGNSTYTFVGHI